MAIPSAAALTGADGGGAGSTPMSAPSDAIDMSIAPDVAAPSVQAPLGTAADRPMVTANAQSIARQIVHGAADQRRDSHGPTDIALDPPELGRVRMSFAEVNGALSLTITAERPETAEMMRRHVALLTEEFARAGLDAPMVDISHGGGDGRRDARATPGAAMMFEAMPEVSPADPGQPARLASIGGGLDLRL